MTTDTSKAPERFRHSAQNPHKLVGHPEGEWVSFTDFTAMQARAEKAEAKNERLREALSDLVDCTELATGECDWPDGQDPLSRARATLERKEATP